MAPGGRRSQPRTSGQPQSMGNTQSGNITCNSAPSRPRKGRGKAKNVALAKLLEATGGKLKADIVPGRRRAKGEVGDLLVREIGIMIRTHIPLTCHNWGSVKKPQRQILYTRIMEKFDIDIRKEHVVKAIASYMGRRFKDYRNELHGYYKRFQGTHHQKKQQPPEDVSKDDWGTLCDWFQSDAFKRDVETQQELSRIELYRLTHFTSEKGWSSDIAEKKYMEMLALKSQNLEEGSIQLTDDEIVDQVLGKRPGYIVGLGHCVVPLASSSHDEEMSELARKAEQAEKRAEEAEKRAEEAGNNAEELRTQVEAQNSMIQDLYDKMNSIISQPRHD